jgi:hypothetical protein
MSSGPGEIDFIGNRGPGSSGGFNFYDLPNSAGATPDWLMKLNRDGLWVNSHFVDPSDINLKKNIVPVSDIISKLKTLRVVNYKWKNSKWDQGNQLGVIAQEIEAVFAELVKETDNPDCTVYSGVCDQPKIKGVDYPKLAAVALQGVKELSDKVESLEKRLEALEKNPNK